MKRLIGLLAHPSRLPASLRYRLAALARRIHGVRALARHRKLIRTIYSRGRVVDGGRRYRWVVKISAPSGAAGDVWGDVFFAEDLAEALRSHGQEVFVDRYQTRVRPDSEPDDIVVNLRGYHREAPDEGAVNILWVISHPDWVSVDELQSGYDLVYAASVPWAAKMSSAASVKIEPLLQATNPSRFRPGLSAPLLRSDILFVGKSRNVFRPIVRDAIAADAKLSIFGDGWGQFVDPQYIKAEFLDNDRVPGAYGDAKIVLNDHWEDMRVEGFLSNRLFDAVATGARVISDDMQGQSEIFGGSVVEYRDAIELVDLLGSETIWPDEPTLLRNAESVHQHHSFHCRAQSLLNDVESLLGRK